ncbi:MAG: PTS glucose transporter subunit IIA [Erysipelotrichaceae bacterium]|nr:PTS glucose transporter subunit IIA [Erysipelotrichaceae bacterium]
MFNFFKKDSSNEIYAVCDGLCIPLEEVKDEVFASKAMGDGVAIIPDSSEIVAPCDGELTLVANTGHAFGMTTKDGVEILVHIGIDTVHLGGEGFTVLCATNDSVKKGQPLIRFDYDFMKSKNIDMTTMIILLSRDKTIDKYSHQNRLSNGKDVAFSFVK